LAEYEDVLNRTERLTNSALTPRFEARAARGSTKRAIALLDKLDRAD
jgi:hypothetical protein